MISMSMNLNPFVDYYDDYPLYSEGLCPKDQVFFNLDFIVDVGSDNYAPEQYAGS